MTETEQLGFDALLHEAETSNKARALERRCGHLPDTMDDALPYFRSLLERHHAHMLAAEVDKVMRQRAEARDLALWLDRGEPGIIADDESPGSVLARETAAAPGTVLIWGQEGTFEIAAAGVRVRIELHGVFGIGARHMYWPGFAARAVDRDKPFISETGYRSFLGIYAEAVPGLGPDAFCRDVIERYVADDLNGNLLAIAGDRGLSRRCP